MPPETMEQGRWHTVAATSLGELTLVRDTHALRGLYYPHHWHMPGRSTFGPVSDEGFAHVIGQIEEYLDGRRHHFEVPLDARGLDARDADFQRRVWALVQEIAYGETASYGELARQLGGGVTAQDVGAAVGRNPLCVLIPCHRVVGRNGQLTGYAGGIDRKRKLLHLERAHTAQAPPAQGQDVYRT